MPNEIISLLFAQFHFRISGKSIFISSIKRMKMFNYNQYIGSIIYCIVYTILHLVTKIYLLNSLKNVNVLSVPNDIDKSHR